MGEGVSPLSLPRNGCSVVTIPVVSVPFPREYGCFDGFNMLGMFVSSSRSYLPKCRLAIGAREKNYMWSNDAIDTNSADLMEITLSGAFPTRTKGEGWPDFYIGRGLASMVLLPFQEDLGFGACPASARSDTGASMLPVFDLPISWVPDLEILSLPTRSLGESGSPVPVKSFIGGRFRGHGCVKASVYVTSGRSSIIRSRHMGVRKFSLDLVCHWGPNPSKDSRLHWDMGSLKQEVPRTGLGAGLGFLPPVLGIYAVHADGIADANDASRASADPGGFSSIMQSFAQSRADPIKSDIGVRPQKSGPDQACWDLRQIRLVSGYAKPGFGVPSGVARTPGVLNADTVDTINAAAVADRPVCHGHD